ncbi:MAG: aminopeptidase P N-terminal domain-containing protein [Vicingaceae bacterium]|nr:aminopeptidase P N-terminal domain-containing protein [Vicingaceae bacterium]
MKKFLIILILTPLSLLAQEIDFDLILNLLPDTNKIKEELHTDHLPASFFAKNRQALRDSMPNNSVAVLFSSPIRNRSNDVDYEYHQDPNFYYLTGLTEPHAAIIIYKEDQEFSDDLKTNEIVFLQKRDRRDEMWTGKRLGIEGAALNLGIKTAMENEAFLSFENEYQNFDNVLIFKEIDDVKNTIKKGDLFGLLQSFNATTQNLNNINTRDLNIIMASLRQIKAEEEIELMRKAIDMTCDAQIELMKALKPEMTEYQSEAIVEYIFKKNGAEYPGFPTIMGGGEHSCIIHYSTNRKQLKSNDLLVSDIGAEYHGYTADVTRTLPVNGKFSKEEAIIYNIVLKAQQAGIDSCKAGNKFWTPHNAATKIITDELIALEIIEKRYHVQRYFMHGTSHYLGLDVHDLGLNGRLEPGNVITVEPGIYIPAGSKCDPKWWNIGIRIEDDILITTKGPENLSEKAPRKIEEIEALMQKVSSFE